jgi:hypothetical protein
MADDPSNTIRISVEDAIDRFLELELGDKWIRISEEEWNLHYLYNVERRPCPKGLKERAEEVFFRIDARELQRKDVGERWVRTHLLIECADETRTTGWDDVRSGHVTKVTLVRTVSLAELEQELRKRFGERAEQQIARLAGTVPAEESSVTDAAPSPPSTAVGEPVPEASSEESPRGTPEQYDWDEGFRHVRKLWAELGDPRRPENAKDGWRADADVGRAVQECIRKPDPNEPDSFKEPDFKHTMKRIGPLLKELRGAHKGA